MLENDVKRIFVYTEAAPVHCDVVAHGLHRAGPPILRSISDFIDGIAIYQIGRQFQKNDLDRDLAPFCASVARLPTYLCKALRRLPFTDLGISDALPPMLLARQVRNSSADTLFAMVGSDYGTMMRAARLATMAGKSYVLYVVDDFIASLRFHGASEKTVQMTQTKSAEALRGAKHVFTITDGLGEHLRKSYGIHTTTLNLAFEAAPGPTPPVKKQIVYVGSINFLYAEGLRDLFKVVKQVRLSSGVDLTVRLTVGAEVAARELGRLPDFVVCAHAGSSEDLAREIASSLFAFLPYSFDMRSKVMVATSFPSKSMEYLAYARSIVVYGPDYGVATRLFRAEKLPSVVSSQKVLESAIRFHLAETPEYSSQYRRYLVALHSLAAARKAICDALGMEVA
jgi:hypothetical protein